MKMSPEDLASWVEWIRDHNEIVQAISAETGLDEQRVLLHVICNYVNSWARSAKEINERARAMDTDMINEAARLQLKYMKEIERGEDWQHEG